MTKSQSQSKEEITFNLDAEIVKAFKEFAKETDGNYDIAFKLLWRDFWEYQQMKWGLIDLGTIHARLQALEGRIDIEPTGNVKVIRTMGGKVITKNKMNKVNE